MGNAQAGSKDAPATATTKDVKATEAGQSIQFADDLYEEKEMNGTPCWRSQGCWKTAFVVLAIVIALTSLALIIVSVSTAIATQMYSSELSGRLVAMVTLAATAAVTLSVIIYAVIAVFKKKVKPLHASSLVLVIVALIQAVLAGVSVRVSPGDEFSLSRSLIESFNLARDNNQRHVKIWDTTQSDLACCGVYGPAEYRRPGVPPYVLPDIPISCCASYDSNRSDLVQERARQICKARGEFYERGCKEQVFQVFRETSTMVLSVTILLIVLEVLAATLGSILSKEKGSTENLEDIENKPSDEKSGKL